MNEDDMMICPSCGGTGSHPYTNKWCKECNGTGEVKKSGDERRSPAVLTRYHTFA